MRKSDDLKDVTQEVKECRTKLDSLTAYVIVL